MSITSAVTEINKTWTVIESSDIVASSRSDINNNFNKLYNYATTTDGGLVTLASLNELSTTTLKVVTPNALLAAGLDVGRKNIGLYYNNNQIANNTGLSIVAGENISVSSSIYGTEINTSIVEPMKIIGSSDYITSTALFVKDFPAVLTPTPIPGINIWGVPWTAISSTSDGKKVVACSNIDYIYTSDDYGVTWTKRISSGIRYWTDVRYSKDGTKIVACAKTASTVYLGNGAIYISTDDGATWTANTAAGEKNWYGVAISSDGSVIAGCVYNGHIYVSTDGGITWPTETSTNLLWSCIDCSSDGSVILAGTSTYSASNTHKFWFSKNTGSTWTVHPSTTLNNSFLAAKCSADGNTMIISTYLGPYFYVTSDCGDNWTLVNTGSSGLPVCLTMSYDGNKILAGHNRGYIRESTDKGLTWTTNYDYNIKYWSCITVSSDGTKFVGGCCSQNKNVGYNLFTNVDIDMLLLPYTSYGQEVLSATNVYTHAQILSSSLNNILSSFYVDNNDVNTLVHSNSANWDNSYSTVSTNSANWNGVYSTVQSTSSNWIEDTAVNSLVHSNSANWDNSYSTVSTNSASWGGGTGDAAVNSLVHANSANWDGVYSTVQSTSSSWGGGASTAYKTIYIDASDMISRSDSGATYTTFQSSTNKIMDAYMLFDPSVIQYTQYNTVLEEKWDLSSIKAKFIWTSYSNMSGTSAVVWGIQGQVAGDYNLIENSWGTAQTITDSTSSALQRQTSQSTSAIILSGTPELNDMLYLQFYRDATNGSDTMKGYNAQLKGVLIQYNTSASAATAW